MLWIFFICTFKWSVLLNTCPQVLQGCGTNLPWCWCLTCLSKVHFKLKIRAHMAHWNLGPSGVWHMVYTESVLVNLLSLLGGEAPGEVLPCPPGMSLMSPVIGHPWPINPGPEPESETREGVTVWHDTAWWERCGDECELWRACAANPRIVKFSNWPEKSDSFPGFRHATWRDTWILAWHVTEPRVPRCWIKYHQKIIKIFSQATVSYCMTG